MSVDNALQSRNKTMEEKKRRQPELNNSSIVVSKPNQNDGQKQVDKQDRSHGDTVQVPAIDVQGASSSAPEIDFQLRDSVFKANRSSIVINSPLAMMIEGLSMAGLKEEIESVRAKGSSASSLVREQRSTNTTDHGSIRSRGRIEQSPDTGMDVTDSDNRPHGGSDLQRAKRDKPGSFEDQISSRPSSGVPKHAILTSPMNPILHQFGNLVEQVQSRQQYLEGQITSLVKQVTTLTLDSTERQQRGTSSNRDIETSNQIALLMRRIDALEKREAQTMEYISACVEAPRREQERLMQRRAELEKQDVAHDANERRRIETKMAKILKRLKDIEEQALTGQQQFAECLAVLSDRGMKMAIEQHGLVERIEKTEKEKAKEKAITQEASGSNLNPAETNIDDTKLQTDLAALTSALARARTDFNERIRVLEGDMLHKVDNISALLSQDLTTTMGSLNHLFADPALIAHFQPFHSALAAHTASSKSSQSSINMPDPSYRPEYVLELFQTTISLLYRTYTHHPQSFYRELADWVLMQGTKLQPMLYTLVHAASVEEKMSGFLRAYQLFGVQLGILSQHALASVARREDVARGQAEMAARVNEGLVRLEGRVDEVGRGLWVLEGGIERFRPGLEELSDYLRVTSPMQIDTPL